MRYARRIFVFLVAIVLIGVAHAEVVDSSGDVGMYASIAIDDKGNPHISYYDYVNEKVKYAYRDSSGTWHFKTLRDIGRPGYSSIAVSNGDVYITYPDSLGDMLMIYTTDSRVILVSINPCDANRSSVAVDSNGNISISCLKNGRLQHVYHVYYGVNNDTWVNESVDASTTAVVYPRSLALDSSGYPHIAYYDSTNQDLKYAFKDSVGWHIGTIDSTGDVGKYASIALDSNGNPHIAYYDSTNGDLKYAHWDSSSWQIETVDSTGDVGMYATIAVDAGGNPHIAYYDNTNEDLKYAYRDSSGWHIETVDSTGDVGKYASIALDSNGNPHIAYAHYEDYYTTSSPYYYNLKYTTKQPTIVSLQGGITDLSGNPVSTASLRVTIKNSDGNAVYQETLNNVMSGGKFTALLGATKKLELWQGVNAYNLILEADIDATSFTSADVTFGDNSPSGDLLEFYP